MPTKSRADDVFAHDTREMKLLIVGMEDELRREGCDRSMVCRSISGKVFATMYFKLADDCYVRIDLTDPRETPITVTADFSRFVQHPRYRSWDSEATSVVHVADNAGVLAAIRETLSSMRERV